jgi:hypothetical protein
MTAKPKLKKLFDPATARELHIVVFTNAVRQEINTYDNEKDAEQTVRDILRSKGLYTDAFSLVRYHVTSGQYYETWKRESYERTAEGSYDVIACLRSEKAECPINFGVRS